MIKYVNYTTINLVNGKEYKGVHKELKWPNIDSYLGSGLALLSSIKFYGKHNFICIIDFVWNSSEEAYCMESLIVDAFYCESRLNYNIALGGDGGNLGDEANKQKSKTLTAFFKTPEGKSVIKERNKKSSISHKEFNKTTEGQFDILRRANNRKSLNKTEKGKEILKKSGEKISKILKKFNKTDKGKESRIASVIKQKEFWNSKEREIKRLETNKIMSEKKRLTDKFKRKECPHYNKKMDPANYMRWHGDVCKENKDA